MCLKVFDPNMFSIQAPSPDVYRGKYRADDPNPATAYANEVRDIIERAQERGGKVRFDPATESKSAEGN